MRDTLVTEDAHTRADPRILLFSQRNATSLMWEVPQAEFEDVIMDVDQAEMVAPSLRTRAPSSSGSGSSDSPGAGLREWTDEARELGSRVLSGVRVTMGLPKRWPITPVDIEGDYELFFATFHFPHHISIAKRLRGLRKRCKRMACFLIEWWTPQIAQNKQYLHLLDEFDDVFLFNAASLPHIQKLTRARCHFLATAVDAFRFCPWPLDVPRTVDVYHIGRTSPHLHRQFVALASADFIHYIHARVNHEVPDYHGHRVLYASLLKRSRFFPAFRINEDRSVLTGGEEALATRFFEGAAAGSVLLGSRPRCPEFDDLFPYEDAVLPIAWDSQDVARILHELGQQPERLARIRRDSVAHALRHHDWVHRWAAVLDVLGMPHTQEMRERMVRLESLASAVEANHWFNPAREAASTPAARGMKPNLSAANSSSPSPFTVPGLHVHKR